jgi:hypothetical protein
LVESKDGSMIGCVRLLNRLWRPWGPWLLFAVIAIIPVLRRLHHPTLLGDDVMRVVDLVQHPLGELLFRPFSEHTAPLFELVSWLAWQLCGHDVRSAPMAFCVASVTPWLLVLVLVGFWLWRETASPTAAFASVALVAQSPLVLETVYWYSASSFTWALVGILTALLGASCAGLRPRASLILIATGQFLGAAATTLGVLAGPLAILRVCLQPRLSARIRFGASAAAAAGLFIYLLLCRVGGASAAARWFHNRPGSDVWTGLAYALSVPGRVLCPAALGVPVSWMVTPKPAAFSLGLGILAALAFLALLFWPRAVWKRRLVLVGGAMIYGAYVLTYVPRVGMLKSGEWTEAQFLYRFAGRYHILPLLGLASVVAALIAAAPLVRRCDGRRGLPALAGAGVGLLMLGLQASEVEHWDWMLHQPDQRQTLAALHHVGEVAKCVGITRTQLVRMFDPCYRPWNGSVLHDRPSAFHLMNLAAGAPAQVAHRLPDEEARRRLLDSLSPLERVLLGSGTCVSLNPARLPRDARSVSLARLVRMRGTRSVEPGRFQGEHGGSWIEFEFESGAGGRFLELPGLIADQDVLIWKREPSGWWRAGRVVRWLRAPRCDVPAVIDLERLFHWPDGPVWAIRVQFTRPGEIALERPPRLLR